MDLDDTEPPVEGPGEEPQLYCKPIADDASDGDGADPSDAGDPRLILSTHRALDALGGLVNPSDIRALHVVLRPRPRQLAGHQGLRRGQLGRAGGSREESPPLFP